MQIDPNRKICAIIHFLANMQVHLWCQCFSYLPFSPKGTHKWKKKLMCGDIILWLEGFPWYLSGKESACHWKRHIFYLWSGKITWRMKWQPTPVFLPGKLHGQGSLVGYSRWGWQKSRHDLAAKKANKN